MAKKDTSIATKAETGIAEAPANPMDMFASILGVTQDKLKSVNAAANAAVDQSAIQVSRVLIAQSNSPPVVDQLITIGSLYDSISKESFTVKGEAPWLKDRGTSRTLEYCLFLPVFNLFTEFVKWPTQAEKDAGMKGFHWKSLVITEPRVREGLWKPEGTWVPKEGEKKTPPVTKTQNVIGFMLDPVTFAFKSNPVIMSFSRTSAPAGRRFITACTTHEGSGLPNFYGRAYYFFTEQKQLKTDEKVKYRVMDFAKGPSILDMANGDMELFGNLAKRAFNLQETFTDPEQGRAKQELYLNIAEVSDDESDAGGVDDGNTLEAGEGSDDVSF